MEEIFTYFSSLGAVGIIAFALFKNTLDEKKEDREMYKKTVDSFTDISKSYVGTISTLTSRIENVEECTEKIDTKLDKLLDKVGE